MPADVAELVAAARDGDRAAFDELVKATHPTIARLGGTGFADAAGTRPFYVTEYHDAQTLEQYVQRFGAIPLRDVQVIARLLAEALQANATTSLSSRGASGGRRRRRRPRVPASFPAATEPSLDRRLIPA